MSDGQINVGLVGASFMGRAHSNAYLKVGHYFDLPTKSVMRAACDINSDSLNSLVIKYGWETKETSWEKLIKRDDIDLIDICTANITHLPIAVAAANAGKHIICEKPLCLNSEEAQQMLDVAESANISHMVAFNYRRVPAILLAKNLIEQGKIGKIHHFNAVYYQDWLVDPDFPFVWRHYAEEGGSGAHGDMNAHTVDLARFLVGEFESVCAAEEIFVKERPLMDGKGKGKVTADDALYFIARFRDGALGSFMATRFATGRKNFLRLEIFGSNGALYFNLERLNELGYYSNSDDKNEKGFRNILVTESTQPYINMWWPPGHIIGWEHTFIHEIGDLLLAIYKKKSVTADFYDGLRCQQVLDAALISSKERKWVDIPE